MRKLSLLPLFFIVSFVQAAGTAHAGNDPTTGMRIPLTVYQYIEQFAPIAVAEMKRTGIPASITLSQAIAESSFGNSPLAYEANNHFGIKCGKDWHGGTYSRQDDDYDSKGTLLHSCFRTYKTADESFFDHSEFLKTRERYKTLFAYAKTDYKSWAYGLQDAGYATLPTYFNILITNIEQYKLYEYDQILVTEDAKLIVYDEQNLDSNIFVNSIDLMAIEASSVEGVYKHNNLLMVFASPTDTPESIARKHKIDPKLLRNYNDLRDTDVLYPSQFVYLEPKRHYFKESKDIHTVQNNENMYLISQFYGVKLSYLLSHNSLSLNEEPIAGSLIYLRTAAPMQPVLRQTIDHPQPPNQPIQTKPMKQ